MKRARHAFLLSFLVYLLPIVHGHGGSILGLTLWTEFTNTNDHREALWLVMDAGLALALQAAAFGLFDWILKGGGWRWVAVPACLPAALWLLNVMYLVEIPKQFLIEKDNRPEIGEWPVACEIAGASTAGLPTGITLALEKAGEIWIRTGKQGLGYGLISARDCSIASRQLFFAGGRGSIGYVTGGGTMYYRTDVENDGIFDHWYFGTGAPGATRLRTPSRVDYWSPTVAAEGGAIGWLETKRESSGRIEAHYAVVREISTGNERRIELQLTQDSSLRLLDFSLANGVFYILRDYRELLTVDSLGNAIGAGLRIDGFDSLGNNIRLLKGGWVVWDGYRESGRYRIAWALPVGRGSVEIPKGSSITSLTVDPDGRYIAAATTRSLSIGDVPDTMFVLRTADGAEIYRRYLPSYTRSHVGFLGPGQLATTTIGDGGAVVRILKVPLD
jgi:hypothetical protein